MYQRVYQNLVVKAGDVLPPDLNVRDEVGPTFDTVFALRSDNAGQVPRLLTWPGFNDFFLKQDKALIDLTAMDAWVLGQRKLSQLSEADRKDHPSGQRPLRHRLRQPVAKLLTNLDVQTLESPEQALDVLAAITGNDQPFQRVLASLDDNTRIRKISDVEGTRPRPSVPASVVPLWPLMEYWLDVVSRDRSFRRLTRSWWSCSTTWSSSSTPPSRASPP